MQLNSNNFGGIIQDLEDVVYSLSGINWDDVRDSNFFITGGTGFIGTWLVQSLIWLNRKFNLNIRVVLLTRKPEHFIKAKKWIYECQEVSILKGDVRNFDSPKEKFEYVVHAATESSTNLNNDNPLEMLDVIVSGTKNVLNFAANRGAKKIIYLSSGAIYGKQPPDITHVDEGFLGGPPITNSSSAYAEGKRVAELMCICYAQKFNFEIKIARLFAFVGPFLKLDSHFAIGNFIRDGLMGGPIIVKGDGTPYRSYMYASDLSIWLWTILFKGESCRPYNVGSEEPISIADLAYLVSSCFDKPIEVKIMKQPIPGVPPERYVPSTKRAREELGLTQKVGLKEAILKTIEWYRKHPRFLSS